MQFGECHFLARAALTLNNSAVLHHTTQDRIPLLPESFCAASY